VNHFIYIPGLGGEQIVDRQRKIVAKWPKRGKHGALFLDARWHNQTETYAEKLDRICKTVQVYKTKNPGKYCVIGASAGASMAINVFDELKLDGLVTIAGKIRYPNRIGPHYRTNAPHFYDSVVDSDKRLQKLSDAQKRRILAIVPLVDEVVWTSEAKIPGAKNVRLAIPGHFLGIGAALTLGHKRIFRWFEKISNN
jgi:hypothetical protein